MVVDFLQNNINLITSHDYVDMTRLTEDNPLTKKITLDERKAALKDKKTMHLEAVVSIK